MVTMELVLDLDRGGRLARALPGRVLLWDTGQAGRGGGGVQHVATGGQKLFAIPLIGSVTVQGREGKG